MPSSKYRRQVIINLGLFAISLIPLILYLFLIYRRIGLPFDLEWGEGAGINQIQRILSGKQLFVAPTFEFAPLVYTPFYYWMVSLFSRLGLTVILAGRLISVLASLGTAALTAYFVIQETDNRLAGWLASALFLACYGLSDGFYDLIRVDSLYVFSLLLAFGILRGSSKPLAMISAGFMLAVGFYIKQSAVLVFIPLIGYLLIHNWKSSWLLVLSVLAGVLVPFYWINARTGGWFGYYILDLPREHGYSLISAVDFWIGDMLGPLGIAVGFGLIYLLSGLLGREDADEIQTPSRLHQPEGRQRVILIALFAVGAIGTGWITRASNGGGANNVISAYASLSLLFGLGFNEAENWIADQDRQSILQAILLPCLVGIQLIGLIYNPFNFVPTTAEVRANEEILVYFDETDGLIWAPYRSHLPGLIDKETSIHAVNLFEMTGYFKGDILPEGITLVDQIRKDICNQAYSVIMLDQPIPWIEQQIIAAYVEDNRFVDHTEARRSPLLDWQGGFTSIYIPRQGIDPDDCP